MEDKTKDKESLMQQENDEAIKNEIVLTAILNAIYAQKISKETIQIKVRNQLNSMQVSMDKINPKFSEKSKNYDKVKQQTREILDQYENHLVQFCQIWDTKIQEVILKKVELESKWLVEVMKNREKEKHGNPKNLEKEIKIAKKKINQLNEQKVRKVFEAMETGEKAISTQIRKPRTIKKIGKFFMDRFHTYRVIVKSVLEPVEKRVNEFKEEALKEVDWKNTEFDLQEVENKIREMQRKILK